MEPSSPEEIRAAIDLAEWKGEVNGRLASVGETIGGMKASIDRIESKVNALKNEQSKQQGGFKVGAIVGSFVASAVLLVFAAFVTGVFS